jgi:4-amino-4-deoxy-L-arabinose transferase-like glycosyltransferase
MKKTNLLLPISILVLSTLLVRFIAFYVLADTQLENEWFIIIHNLALKGVLGINVAVDSFTAIPKLAEHEDIVLPSVFMPPFYSYYIYFFKYFFSNFTNYINLIIFSQILLSTVAIYLFFEIIRMSYSFNYSILFSLIFSLVPINIYSSVQISSVSIQIFLIIYFLYILKKFSLKEANFKQLTIFSILSGLLILLRGEFILFYFFSLIYFFIFISRKIKFLIISLIISSIIISPYIIRNYNIFDTFILTKSFGYNLLKGNNPEFKVEGSPNYIEKVYNRNDLNIKADNFYEIKLDDFYKEKSLEYIKDNPKKYFYNYLLKVFSFLFFDTNSSYPNYYNIYHLLPKLILSFSSIFGAVIVLRKKGFLQYLSIYFFSNILFFSIFFILPRYSLILMPIQILLSIEFYRYCLRKFFN